MPLPLLLLQAATGGLEGEVSIFTESLDIFKNITLTIFLFRYESQPWSPSILYTLCRQYQESQDKLYRDVVMCNYSGLGVSFYSTVKEVSKSGSPHSHGLGWRREANTGPGSLSLLLGRLQRGESGLTWEERRQVVEVAKGAITVTTSVATLNQQFPLLTLQEAEGIVRLARRVQIHRCTNHCSSST